MEEVFAGEPATKEWQTLAPMNCARSNFALTVVDNTVYVIGGIKGKNNDHLPELASVAEKYDPIQDKWESIEIANFFSLAAFGWT
jgi:N-acetylneuraminic acid mutarotase